MFGQRQDGPVSALFHYEAMLLLLYLAYSKGRPQQTHHMDGNIGWKICRCCIVQMCGLPMLQTLTHPILSQMLDFDAPEAIWLVLFLWRTQNLFEMCQTKQRFTSLCQSIADELKPLLHFWMLLLMYCLYFAWETLNWHRVMKCTSERV